MGISEQLEIRKALVDEIEADLVGPRKGNTPEERENEITTRNPQSEYFAGVFFPGDWEIAEEEKTIYQENWWDGYSRDKNHDGISDFLIWKLQQGDRFFDAGEARIFVRYDHHPTDDDVQRLEKNGIEVTFLQK